MNEYKKVDVAKYVKEGLENGSLSPVRAEKFARIAARRGIEGEEIVSWSVDGEGKEVKEKVDTIKKDENGNTGWVVTKVDEQHDIIVDKNGHVNMWIIDDTTFRKKYEIDPEDETVYRPTGGIQIFVQINENISIFQWGSQMNIAKGGYINITNPDDIYVISKRDFDDTYRIIYDGKKPKIKSKTW